MLDPSPSSPVPFGRYLITERLGRGGMAEVFKGKLTGLDGFERIVCIKRILPELAEQEDFVRLLLDEARITVALHHPNIVQCLDLGRHEGVYFMAMEYIDGRDLQQLYDACEQRKVFFPFKHALHVLGQTLEGLAYAQRAQGPDGEPLDLVHRDLTPSNIFISFDGDVKIGDFGVARASVMKRMETTGKTVGKLGYLSPEQVKGLELDGRSDIFSLGVTLFELLTRTPLFPGDDPDEVMKHITTFDPARTIAAHPTLPNDLADMLLKALAVDRDERYPNAQDFSEDLTDFLFNEGIRVSSRDLSDFMSALIQDTTTPAGAPIPDRADTEHVHRDRLRPQDTFHFADAAGPTAQPGGPTASSAPDPSSPEASWSQQLADQLEPGQSACLVLDGKLFVQLDATALSRQKVAPARVRLGDGAWQPLDQICSAPPSTPGVSFTPGTLAPRLAAILRPHPARWVAAVSEDRAWALRISGGRIIGLVDDRAGPVHPQDLAAGIDDLLRVDGGELLDGPSMASPRESEGVDLALALTEAARRIYTIEDFHRIYESLSHRFERGSVPAEECIHLFTRPELGSLNGIGLPSTFQDLVSELDPEEALTRARAIYVGLSSGLLSLEGLTGP